jgi:hypothetical protein
MSTMTNRQLDAMQDGERAVWFNSLTGDESLVVLMPVGHRVTFLLIALAKRALVQGGMTVGDQLQMLERLMALTDTFITPAVLAAVQPCCETADKMIGEALALDGENGRLTKSWNMLSSWEVFWHFLRLNPSLLEAIRLASGPRNAPQACGALG